MDKKHVCFYYLIYNTQVYTTIVIITILLLFIVARSVECVLYTEIKKKNRARFEIQNNKKPMQNNNKNEWQIRSNIYTYIFRFGFVFKEFCELTLLLHYNLIMCLYVPIYFFFLQYSEKSKNFITKVILDQIYINKKLDRYR